MRAIINIDVTNEMLGIESNPEIIRIAKYEEVEVLSNNLQDFCMIGVKRNGKLQYWVFKAAWFNVFKTA